MDINKGDKVVIKSEHLLHNTIRVGDIGIIEAISNEWLTIRVNDTYQHLPYNQADEWLNKVEPTGYQEPSYITKIKERGKELQGRHKFNKFRFRLKDKVKTKLYNVSREYFTTLKELNYIYTILRQHNEMKRMYAKRKP
jgi:hypothetical protein